VDDQGYFVGFSRVDITPPLDLGVRMGGFLRIHKVAGTVLYPLHANGLCFRHNSQPRRSLILISCDLVGFQYRLVRVIRKIISRKTGVPVSNIVLHFTHTHASPDTIGIFPNRFVDLFTFDIQYPVVKYIMCGIIRAGVESFRTARIRGKIGYGETSNIDPPIAIQRRHPYKFITDPVRFIKITSENDDRLLAILVNYQAHPTQLPAINADIHPEYPGMVVKALLERYPSLKFAAYFNGASGDVTVHGYKGYWFIRRYKQKSAKDAMAYALKLVEILGNNIASYVIEAIDKVPVEEIRSIHVKRRFIFPRIGRIKSVWDRLKFYKTLDAKLRMISKEALDALRIGMFFYFYTFVNHRYLPMLNIIKNGRRIYHQTEIFIISINDITWLSSPGEPFYSYQLELSKMIKSKKFFFSQMNETCGYIFPWSFHVKGGYEKFFSFDALFGQYLFNVFKQEINEMGGKSS